jgi:hypothetical protein
MWRPRSARFLWRRTHRADPRLSAPAQWSRSALAPFFDDIFTLSVVSGDCEVEVTRTRSGYPEPFRREAVRLAELHGKPQCKLTNDPGISDVTLPCALNEEKAGNPGGGGSAGGGGGGASDVRTISCGSCSVPQSPQSLQSRLLVAGVAAVAAAVPVVAAARASGLAVQPSHAAAVCCSTPKRSGARAPRGSGSLSRTALVTSRGARLTCARG